MMIDDIQPKAKIEWLWTLGRDPINSERSADVRFGPHSGLKSDIGHVRLVPNNGSDVS
jgi:hypothetical protein